MRIAMMIGSMQEGGTEGQVVELMRGLRARGHDVRLMLLHPMGRHLETLRQEGFEVFGVGLPRLRPWHNVAGKIGAVRAMVRTVAYLRRARPDVFHCRLFEAEAWGGAAKMLGAPGIFVTSRSNLGIYKSAAPWKQTVQNFYNRLTRAVVANAKLVASDAEARERHLGGGKLRVIYNGVDTAKFASAEPLDLAAAFNVPSDASPVVVSVANLFEYKGYFDLIEAWKRVHAGFPRAHLLCVGRDSGIGDEMKRRVAEAGLAGSVTLAGARDDVPRILRAADLLVLASHEEGFPNVVLEAMASSLAVVATRVGGIPEAVVENETGLLVESRAPEELARALGEMIRDSDRRKPFGEAGRRRAESVFAREHMIARYEELYHELLAPRA